MRIDHLRQVLRLVVVATTASATIGCAFKPAGAAPPATGTGGTTAIDGGLGTSGAAGMMTRTAATSLTISPMTATMTVTNSAPTQTQQYTVTGQVNGFEAGGCPKPFCVPHVV